MYFHQVPINCIYNPTQWTTDLPLNIRLKKSKDLMSLLNSEPIH